MAEEHDVAAVVVGSRGLGRVKSALLGSVSSGVLDHARQPVLIVPSLADPRPPGPVVIGYDGSDHAEAAVAAAGSLLEVREALLQTVWLAYRAVAPAALVGASVAVVSKAAEEIDRGIATKARETAARGARLASTHGLEVRAEAVEGQGNVWRTLLDTADDHRAAAIVVGSRGTSGLESVLVGSVSKALVHHSSVPVLVVRPPK
jgi:nucleotide-binding universal stress UspA family protein